ncbi:MAG: hypothetical protein HY036_03720 [Nitrospirae bacterium]|nr:hypothetical protein [Nitrospirota bacterium]
MKIDQWALWTFLTAGLFSAGCSGSSSAGAGSPVKDVNNDQLQAVSYDLTPAENNLILSGESMNAPASTPVLREKP